MEQAVAVIRAFVALQGRLIAAFIAKCMPRDTSYFRDVSDGVIVVDAIAWAHTRHGRGVRFVATDGRVVDVHCELADFPYAITAWRLSQYAESLGIKKLAYRDCDYVTEEEDEMDKLLVRMEDDHLVRRVKGRLFEISPLPGLD